MNCSNRALSHNLFTLKYAFPMFFPYRFLMNAPLFTCSIKAPPELHHRSNFQIFFHSSKKENDARMFLCQKLEGAFRKLLSRCITCCWLSTVGEKQTCPNSSPMMINWQWNRFIDLDEIEIKYECEPVRWFYEPQLHNANGSSKKKLAQEKFLMFVLAIEIE